MSNSYSLLSFDWNVPLTDDARRDMLDTIVRIVRKWRLEVPAVLFLESAGPLGTLAGQGLVAFSPFAAPLFSDGIQGVRKLHALLEEPETVGRLIEMLTESETDKKVETDAARK